MAARLNCLACTLAKATTLRTGVVVCSSCEAWRHECEARDTLKRPLPEIEHYFELVEKARGAEAKHNLRNEMIALHKSKIVL